jgi:hypothetical protein
MTNPRLKLAFPAPILSKCLGPSPSIDPGSMRISYINVSFAMMDIIS